LLPPLLVLQLLLLLPLLLLLTGLDLQPQTSLHHCHLQPMVEARQMMQGKVGWYWFGSQT
jgi:hypothetical protein